MANIVMVAIGGLIGSVLRYLISGYVQTLSRSFEFPYGTLAVNLFGCFALGFFGQLAESHGMLSSHTRLFIFIGLLGGFTTFSTFAGETMNLLRDTQSFPAMLNVTGHVVLGLTAVWAGRAVVHSIWR